MVRLGNHGDPVPATVLLPVFARLSDRYGRQRMLLVGMSLFVLGSTLCLAAQTMGQFIAFRGVQGSGAAALEALSFLLVAELSGPSRSGTAQASLAGIMAFSFIAGPLIGGLMTDHFGWRSVFLVNLPLGLAAIAVVAWVLPPGLGRRESRATPIDLAGIAVLTASVGLVLVGLNQHVAVPTWTDLRTGGMIAAGAAGLALLVAIERRAVAPVIPLRLLTDRITGRLLVVGATSTFALYACILLLPRYYQLVRGVSATQSGLLVYPLLIGLLVAVNVGAAVIVRRGAFRGTLLLGIGLIASGAVGFLAFDGSSSCRAAPGPDGPDRTRAWPDAVRAADRHQPGSRATGPGSRHGNPPARAPGRRCCRAGRGCRRVLRTIGGRGIGGVRYRMGRLRGLPRGSGRGWRRAARAAWPRGDALATVRRGSRPAARRASGGLWRRSTLDDVTAIDRDPLAGHEAGGVGRKEG